MEKREGYKKTEIGWIPEGWDVVKLGALADKVGSGITPKGGSKVYLDKGIPFFRSQNVLFGKAYIDDIVYISEELHRKMAGTQLQSDDVLLNITGASIGRSCLFPNTFSEGNVNQHVCIIRPNGNLKADFLCLILNSPIGQNQIWNFQAGGNRQGLNFQQIRSFSIPLPTFSEQKKIASILTTVDDKISSIDQQIQQTEQLKKGLMEKLLTEGIRHTEFKETKIGRIPKGWDIDFLEDITREKILDGTHFTPNYSKDGIPFLRVTDIKGDEIDFNSIKYIPVEEHKELIKRCLPEKGDILYSKNGTIGVPKIIDWDWEFSIFVSLALIKPDHQKISNMFLNYLLNSRYAWREIKIRAKQGTVTNLHLEEIRKFRFPVPPLKEQKQIATILSTVDDKIDILTQKKTQYQTLKKGLSQQLLTGQMRVKI